MDYVIGATLGVCWITLSILVKGFEDYARSSNRITYSSLWSWLLIIFSPIGVVRFAIYIAWDNFKRRKGY